MPQNKSCVDHSEILRGGFFLESSCRQNRCNISIKEPWESSDHVLIKLDSSSQTLSLTGSETTRRFQSSSPRLLRCIPAVSSSVCSQVDRLVRPALLRSAALYTCSSVLYVRWLIFIFFFLYHLIVNVCLQQHILAFIQKWWHHPHNVYFLFLLCVMLLFIY